MDWIDEYSGRYIVNILRAKVVKFDEDSESVIAYFDDYEAELEFTLCQGKFSKRYFENLKRHLQSFDPTLEKTDD